MSDETEWQGIRILNFVETTVPKTLPNPKLGYSATMCCFLHIVTSADTET